MGPGTLSSLPLQVARLLPHLSNGAVVVSERGNSALQNALFEDAVLFIPEDQPTVQIIRKRSLLAKSLSPSNLKTRDGTSGCQSRLYVANRTKQYKVSSQ